MNHEWVPIGEVRTSPESASVMLEYCRHIFECPAYRYGGKVLVDETENEFRRETFDTAMKNLQTRWRARAEKAEAENATLTELLSRIREATERAMADGDYTSLASRIDVLAATSPAVEKAT